MVKSPEKPELQVGTLQPSHPDYPQKLKQHWNNNTPPKISSIGNPKLLQQQKTLAIFCSVKCPGDLILKTYDLARSLRDQGIATISGFHSPMEKECLTILLRGKQVVVHCPARSLEKMRLLKEQKTAIQQNRLLILSPFQGSQHRMTSTLAQKRNQFVAALADAIFITYASPGGKTEMLAKQAVSLGKPLLTFASSDNEHLIRLGAQNIENFPL
ncbi:MAG: DNA-processing protein DprA [Cyanobacteria bacterium P01_C01_bin.69]